MCMGCCHAKTILPELPHDVLRCVGENIDHSAYTSLDKTTFTQYRNVLMAFRLHPHQITKKMDAYVASFLSPIVDIGYTSFGHGYGQMKSLWCRISSRLRVNEHVYRVAYGDMLRRDPTSGDIFLNGCIIGSRDDIPFGSQEDFEETIMETTPGW